MRNKITNEALSVRAWRLNKRNSFIDCNSYILEQTCHNLDYYEHILEKTQDMELYTDFYSKDAQNAK